LRVPGARAWIWRDGRARIAGPVHPQETTMTRFSTRTQAAAFALTTLAMLPAAQAISFTQNDVTLDINGVINGYYVVRESKVTAPNGSTSTTTNSGISNGLLPGWINFVATTKVDGLDLKAHISFAPGINNNSTVVGLPIGNQAGAGTVNPYSQIDTRNVYFSLGDAQRGTVKIGRDIGLFGQNIILSDMTLLGVGGTSNAGIPFNTTFGMIGHGYMYTGFQPQITYTTPKLGELQASAGLFQPSRFAGDETKTPGLQAKVDYGFAGPAPGQLWAGMVTQKTHCSASPCTPEAFTATGVELGAKATVAGFDLLGYGFRGKGLGLSTVGAQFLGGSDGSGGRTDSRGYLLQATYKLGATKLGINHGENRDQHGAAGAGSLHNKGSTLGVYHGLNKYVTLVGEFNHERQTNTAQAGGITNRTVSLGAILFF
jgi:hypothetical protein